MILIPGALTQREDLSGNRSGSCGRTAKRKRELPKESSDKCNRFKYLVSLGN